MMNTFSFLKKIFAGVFLLILFNITSFADFLPQTPNFPHGKGIVRESGDCNESDNRCLSGLSFPSFNNFTDTTVDGKTVEGFTDERHFVVAKNIGSDGQKSSEYSNKIIVEEGDYIQVRAYVHNNATVGYTPGIAKDVKIGMEGFIDNGSGEFYTPSGTTASLRQFISSSNATPQIVSDDIIIESKDGKELRLKYYNDSNSVSASKGHTVNSLDFVSGGSLIGDVKGCVPDSFQVWTFIRVVAPEKTEYDLKLEKHMGLSQTEADGKTKKQMTVSVGDTIYYRVDIENLSTSKATPSGTQIIIDYDESKESIEWKPSICSDDGSKLICTDPAMNMLPGGSEHMYYTVKVSDLAKGKTVVSRGEIKPNPDLDTNHNNDTDSNSYNVLGDEPVKEYDLKLEKHMGLSQTEADGKTKKQMTVSVGDTIYYRVDIENLSTSKATPSGTQIIIDYDESKESIEWKPSICSDDGSKLICTDPAMNMLPGGSEHMYYTVKVSDLAKGKTVVSRGEIKPNPDLDTNHNNDTDSNSYNVLGDEPVKEYDLKLEKHMGLSQTEADGKTKKQMTVSVGDTIYYRVDIENLSTSKATPSGTQIIIDYDESKESIEWKPSICSDDGSKLICTDPAMNMLPGGSEHMYYTVKVSDLAKGKTVVSRGEIKPNPDLDTNHNNDTDSNSYNVLGDEPVKEYDLKLEKHMGLSQTEADGKTKKQMTVSVGDTIYYRVDIENLSTSKATPSGTQIIIDYDESKESIEWKPSICSDDGSKLICTDPAMNMLPGGSEHMYYTVKVSDLAKGKTVVSRGEIKPNPDLDTNHNNDTDSNSYNVLGDEPVKEYDLKLEKHMGLSQTEADGKTKKQMTVSVGDTIYYRVDIENLSTSKATPSGTQIIIDYDESKESIEWKPSICSDDGSKLICTDPAMNMLPGGSEHMYYTVKVSDLAKGKTVVSRGEIKPNPDLDTNHNNDTDSNSYNVLGDEPVDITIDKTVNPTVSKAGDTVSYTLNYQNLTDSIVAEDVKIQDFLPNEYIDVGTISFDSQNNVSCSVAVHPDPLVSVFQGKFIECNIGNLKKSDGVKTIKYTAKIKVGISDGTNITNTVKIATSTKEINLVNNTSSATVSVNEPVTNYDLGIDKKIDGVKSKVVNKGSEIEISLDYENISTSTKTALDVKVIDNYDETKIEILNPLPTGCVNDGSKVECSIGSLVPGQKGQIKLKGKLLTSFTSGTTVNIGIITSNPDEDTNGSNNSSSATVSVNEPVTNYDLGIDKKIDGVKSKVVNKGSEIEISLDYENISTSTKTALDVKVIDNYDETKIEILNPLPTGCVNDGSKVECSIGSLVPGQKGQIKLKGKLLTSFTSGTTVNIGIITSNPDEDTNGSNNSSSATVSVNEPVTNYDLGIDKKIDGVKSKVVNKGSEIEISLDYENISTSTKTALDVKVIDNYDETKIEILNPLPTGCVNDGSKVECSIGSLVPGQKGQIKLKGKLLTSFTSGTTVNIGIITSNPDEDTNGSNNSSSATVSVNEPVTNYDLGIDKKIDGVKSKVVNKGSEIEISLDYENISTSTKTALDVKVIDNYDETKIEILNPLPTGCVNDGSKVECSIGSLVPGQKGQIKLKGKLLTSFTSGTTVNIGIITSNPDEDTNGSNNSSSATVSVNEPVTNYDLGIDKKIDGVKSKVVNKGSEIEISLDYENISTSTKTALDVKVIDNYDETKIEILNPLPTGCVNDGSKVECSIGSLVPGQKGQIKLKGKLLTSFTSGTTVNIGIITSNPDEDTNGSNNSSSATVSVNEPVTKIPGQCGNAGKHYSYSTTSYPAGTVFCSSGTSPSSVSFPSPGRTVTWLCSGKNGGSNQSCSASRDNKVNTPTPTPRKDNPGTGGGCKTYSTIDLNISKYVKNSDGAFVTAGSRDKAVQIAKNNNNKVTYKIVVSNIGSVSAYNTKVSDSFYSGEGMNQSEIKAVSGATYSNGVFSLIKTVPANGSVEFVYEAKVNTKSYGVGVNTAKIKSFDKSYRCPKILTAKGIGRSSVAYLKAGTVAKAGYILSKRVNKQVVKPGDELIYTLSIKNTGNIDMKNVILVDSFPSEYLEIEKRYKPYLKNNRVLEIKRNFLPVGDTFKVKVRMTVREGVPKGTRIKNILTARSDNVVINDSDTTTVLVDGDKIVVNTCPTGYDWRADLNICKKRVGSIPKTGVSIPLIPIGVTLIGLLLILQRRYISKLLLKI
jgi:uncharacterized repeat protein (TIGR01451 family)